MNPKTKARPTARTRRASRNQIEAESIAVMARLGQLLAEGLERVRGERGTPNEDPVDALYRVVSERDELLNIIAVDRLRGERLTRGGHIDVQFLP